MADQIIAGQNSPTSDDITNRQDVSDILENKLTQLQSLLSCCYGEGGEWFDAIGARHRDNIMWIASDLATDAAQLSQVLLDRVKVMGPPDCSATSGGDRGAKGMRS